MNLGQFGFIGGFFIGMLFRLFLYYYTANEVMTEVVPGDLSNHDRAVTCQISEREGRGVCVGKRLVRAAHQPEDGAVDCHDARATAPLLQNWRLWSDVSPIHCSGTVYFLL